MIARILFTFVFLTCAPVWAQTVQSYYTVATVAALKALTTRPTLVQVTGTAPGIFNWSTTACTLADDLFQITPTAGPSGCFNRITHLEYLRSLKDFGAVCDGATNDRVAILAALAVGVPLTGNNLTCGVSGTMDASAYNVVLQDVALKQLDPNGATDRTTLYHSSAANRTITLRRVTVNRNGAPTDSTIVTTAAGIWISGTVGTRNSNVYLEDVEVYGDGPGIGIMLLYTDGARVINPYVHDMRWLSAVDPCTEKVVGIWANNSLNMTIQNPKVKNLTGSVTAGVPSGACAAGNVIGAATYAPYQSDGIAVSAMTGLTVVGGAIENVGEAIDVTGTSPNVNVWFYGNSYYRAGSIGEKWYHDAYNSGSVGSRSYGAGLFGLAIGGTVGPDLTGPQNLHVYDFIAINTGSNGYWSGATQGPTGIASPETMTTPLNIQCVNCQAIDTGSTMKWGFLSNMATAAALTVVNPYTSGATTAAYSTVPAAAKVLNNSLAGSSTGVTTFASANASATNYTITWPASTGTIASAAFVATGTSGATIPLLNGANTWSGSQSFTSYIQVGGGASTYTVLTSAGLLTSAITRLDAAAYNYPTQYENRSITAASQGSAMRWNYDAGGGDGFQAGNLGFLTTDTWAAVGNRSTSFKVQAATGGAVTDALTATTAMFTVPGGVTATLTNVATTSAICYNTGTGLFTYNSTVGTCTVSTIEAKEIEGVLTPKEGFDLVMSMEPIRYTLKKGRPTYMPGEQIGFAAERAFTKDPRVVAMNSDGTAAGFRYEQYTAALTAALKHMQSEIDELRAANDNLAADVKMLRTTAK